MAGTKRLKPRWRWMTVGNRSDGSGNLLQVKIATNVTVSAITGLPSVHEWAGLEREARLAQEIGGKKVPEPVAFSTHRGALPPISSRKQNVFVSCVCGVLELFTNDGRKLHGSGLRFNRWLHKNPSARLPGKESEWQRPGILRLLPPLPPNRAQCGKVFCGWAYDWGHGVNFWLARSYINLIPRPTHGQKARTNGERDDAVAMAQKSRLP
jgi:hypothetical protein